MFLSQQKKDSIVQEYLQGGVSYRILGKKYGVAFQTIQRWTVKHLERTMDKKKERVVKSPTKLKLDTNDVKELKAELRKSLLLNAFYSNMIDIAEKQFNIDIRKKPGTKQ
jgi:transposase-like protein